jgi:hypothetical protein
VPARLTVTKLRGRKKMVITVKMKRYEFTSVLADASLSDVALKI